VNDLGLVEAVDRLGESVVLAVADTAHRRFDADGDHVLGYLLAQPHASVQGLRHDVG
jgi:hypothetical protein